MAPVSSGDDGGRAGRRARRGPLAIVVATCALDAGCALSYGGGARYVAAADGAGAAILYARGAVGVGGRRRTLALAGEVGAGYGHTPGGVWVHGAPRVEYSSLPRPRGFGWRFGAGALLGGPRGAGDLVAGPSLVGELLYGFDVDFARHRAFAGWAPCYDDDEEAERGYRGTLVAFGLHASYDAADVLYGPVFAFSISLVREAIAPFGVPRTVWQPRGEPRMCPAT